MQGRDRHPGPSPTAVEGTTLFGYRTPLAARPEWLATVDLGSNSFHMLLARTERDPPEVVERRRETVRLAAGLLPDGRIDPETQARALDCLDRFGQSLRALPSGSVRVAGTETLREARRIPGFLHAAERLLGHPIEVLSAREEARMVYLGARRGAGREDLRSLVVDIGGGSTKLAIGRGGLPARREVLRTGCVSMSRAYFADGQLTEKRMRKAEMAAAIEIRPIRGLFEPGSWDDALGCSGTIRAIRRVLSSANGTIQRPALEGLASELGRAGHIRDLALAGLSEERREVFAGGVAVLLGVFRGLGIQRMSVSTDSLREGLLVDLLERLDGSQVRERTIEAFAGRCGIDVAQAQRVEATALRLLGGVAEAWDLSGQEDRRMLRWAARLHEIGLSVSHSQYQTHGGHLIERSDLAGFSRQEQAVLGALVRGHRRTFPLPVFHALPRACVPPAKRLCILLRLSALLHRAREPGPDPDFRPLALGPNLTVQVPAAWLDAHPVLRAELKREKAYLMAAGFRLKVRD